MTSGATSPHSLTLTKVHAVLPERGDVWWCESPDVGGRPAVVLTRTATIARLRRTLVAYATTTIRNLPTEVTLEPGDDPVPVPCVLALDTPDMISVGWLTDRLGKLDEARMTQVCAALAISVDCQ